MNTELFLRVLKRHEGEIFGRDNEIKQLHSIFQRIIPTVQETTLEDSNEKEDDDHAARAQAVFVYGYSGSGKSMLVNHALRRKMPVKGFFLNGKYDQQRSSRAFAGLADACQELCTQLHATETNQKVPVVQVLQEKLAKDFQLLEEIIPDIATLLPDLKAQAALSQTMVPGTFQFGRLKNALRTFLYSVALQIPVVLFIDDLQWADAASIDILQYLVSPDDLTRGVMLLLVGSYRNNELTSDHPLYGPITNLEENPHATKLHVSDLTLGSLNEFLSNLLGYEETPDHTQSLSKAIYQRTRGNIFFVLQFLEMLVTSEILLYSFVTMKWEWNI